MAARCRIDFELMGTIGYSELLDLFSISRTRLDTEGWRVDWYVNIRDVVDNNLQGVDEVAPHEFYETLYNVMDLGLLSRQALNNVDSPSSPGLVRIYVRDSILPSYQVRLHKEYLCKSVEHPYHEIWEYIKRTSGALHNLVRSIGLRPSMDTWTVHLIADGETDSLKNHASLNAETARTVFSLLQDEPVAIKSASIIADNLVIKLLEGRREQYLIVHSQQDPNELATRNLYYLMLAKRKIRMLINELKISYKDNFKDLQKETKKYDFAIKGRTSNISKLLVLRSKILRGSEEFKVTRSHVDLARRFLKFHVNSFLEGAKERPLTRSVPGVIQNEESLLLLFYIGPQDLLVDRIEEIIEESKVFISSMIEIITIHINLRSQRLTERIEIIALGIAILSVVIAIFVR